MWWCWNREMYKKECSSGKWLFSKWKRIVLSIMGQTLIILIVIAIAILMQTKVNQLWNNEKNPSLFNI
jgi:hypothetical protein